MCGIFGVVLKQGAALSASSVEKLLANLYILSESRGKESAGLHLHLPHAGKSWTLKGNQPASELLKSRDYAKVFKESFDAAFSAEKDRSSEAMVLLAHSRLVTNGAAELPENNQPVQWGAVTMIHNGIVVNVDALWAANPHLSRHAQVDTEVMAAMATNAMNHSFNAVAATKDIFSQIKGAASIAWVHEQAGAVTLASNTGDLYFTRLPDDAGIVFASERYILENATKEMAGQTATGGNAPLTLEWLNPGTGLYWDIASSQRAILFSLQDPVEAGQETHKLQRPVVNSKTDISSGPSRAPDVSVKHADESLLKYNEKRIRALKRCSCCVLPETFPFITFDEKGVCSYCRSYKPRYAHMHPTETKKQFIQSLEKYRRSGKEPDVLVPFSGGRDSSYGLHLIHKEFGLKPVTFTYDWGMVTDLARRNIARMCGQLGIQNILVSADIKTKRDNIRKNVSAWLKQPDMGMIPLFMAGDKHFFKVVNQLKRQTGINLDLWCANPLENTDFKSGFCGVRPDFDKSRVDYLSFGRKMQLVTYYGTRFIKNPGYLNSSLLDTFEAFISYYFEPRRDFYFIFDHFIWNEEDVNRTLLSEYDWELAPDTRSTWRIGDGTAPFYNYIYTTARGFSEFDTFRSNQIREGMIGRDEALEAVFVENRPRPQSVKWYLDTIGLDFNSTIRRINQLDTLQLHS